jgi:hypothetical protein
VRSFCYPYGGFDAAAARAVADAGYDNACVTGSYGHPGVFTVPRFFVGQRDTGPRLALKFARHGIRCAATRSAA